MQLQTLIPLTLSLLHLAHASSSLFHLSTTTPLHTSDSIANTLWQHLSTCPTPHYLIVHEPQTLSHISASDFLPSHPMHVYEAEDGGTVPIVHVINTVLMDCLRHGVLHVQELDPDGDVPELDERALRDVLYVRMPEVDVGMGGAEYVGLVGRRRAFVDGVVRRYLDGKAWTLVYMRDRMVEVQGEVVRFGGDGAEIPLVLDQE